jgi:RHS repeat-associated protein
VATYGYDEFARVSSVSGPAGTVNVGWEEGGARLRTLQGGGVYERRCYDGSGRLTEVLTGTSDVACGTTSSSLIAGYVYRYGGAAGARGNRTSQTFMSAGPSETTTYGYDEADRLTGVQYPGRATVYRLGADGTRLGEKSVTAAGDLGPGGFDAVTLPDEHLAYQYDGAGGLTRITDELANHAVVAGYEVDAAGRVTSESRGGVTRSYRWDAEGRLREATVAPAAPAIPHTVSFGYDHAGRRVRKTGPAGTATYLWGDGELVGETPPGGPLLAYQRLGDLAVGIGGERLVHDGLGSVVGRVGGGQPTLYGYDAWGGFRGGAPGPGAPSLAYAGQHWDQDAGLSYAQQRWYQPGTGRFLSEDPVGAEAYLTTPTELAPFLYARGNPLQFKDPLGLGTFCEDRYGTSDTTICAARSTQQYQFERQLQAEREGNRPVAAEAKQLWRQAAKDEQSRAQSEDFHRNVFQPVFFTAVSAAPGAQLGMAVPLIGKGLLVAGTFAASYKGTEVATGEKTELLAKGGPRVVPYKACTDLMTCDRFWDGVSAGSELLLAFAAGTQVQGPQQQVTPAARKTTWEDFLPAAKERLAAAKTEYGELGLQMSGDSSPQASTRAGLLGILRARVAQLAGFSPEGTPVILDENIAGRGVADALRGRGYNVRSVQEIFGKGGVKDPVINQLAETIRGRVLTADRGRQIGQGFGRNAIQVDSRVGTSVDALSRILDEEL